MKGVLKISALEWDVLKIKLSRKYNHLTADDLVYTAGEEGELITRLAKRLRRNEEYVTFTLAKELVHLESNRV